MPTTPASPAVQPHVADLLARHLELHRQVIQHRVIATIDCDVDEDTGRLAVSSWDGWECTACDWMVGRDAPAGVSCPERRRLNTEIRDVVRQIESLGKPAAA